MPTWTTLRSTGFADPQILPSSARKCPSALMRFQLGWHPIGCSWITPRLKSSGAHRHLDNIRSNMKSGPHWQHWRAASLFNPRPRVYIDAGMTMRTHVTAVVRACFGALRQIRSVRRSLSRHALLTLVRALTVSKVEPAARPVAVSLECRRPFGFLSDHHRCDETQIPHLRDLAFKKSSTLFLKKPYRYD